jgi:protein-disulfide isomerase
MADIPAFDPDATRVPDTAEPAPAVPEMEPVEALPAEPGVLADAAEPVENLPGEPGVPGDTPVAAPRPARPAPAVLGYLAAALVGALLLAGSLFATGGIGRPAPSPSPSPAPNAADGPSLGSQSAPVTIGFWADYQCPFCRLEALVFGGSLERAFVLPGVARIVYHDFAFLGQESIDAAVAARCAGNQDPGAYWRYHDLLFASQQGENQGAFARANLVALANIASLDVTTFSACLADPAQAKAVADETAQGKALGVVSTPTLRIVGPGGTRVLTGFSDSWATIRDAVDAVLAPQPSASPGPAGGSAAPASSAAPTATPAATP